MKKLTKENNLFDNLFNKNLSIVLIISVLLLLLNILLILIIIFLIDFNTLYSNDTFLLPIKDDYISSKIGVMKYFSLEKYNIKQCAYEDTNTFSSFIDLFNKSKSYKMYFPSYFLPNNLKYVKDDFSLLEFIIFNQYNMLDNNNTITAECIDSLSKILNEYSRITNKTL